MNYFGKNIRYLRKLKNMTQDDLAEKLGYKSFTTIQKWESGNSEPNLKKLKQLAEIFNVDIDNLAQIDLSKENNNHNTKSNKEQKILRAFNQLNNEGQEKAIAYTQDLVDSGKYSIDQNLSRATQAEIDQEVEAYRKELELQARMTKSSQSDTTKEQKNKQA